MAKENAVSELPQFDKLSQKEMQALLTAVEERVDHRFQQNLDHVPQMLEQMGIKLPKAATRKDMLIRVGIGAAIVATSVVTTIAIQSYRDRKRSLKLELEEENKEPTAQNRVRPVGRHVAVSATN